MISYEQFGKLRLSHYLPKAAIVRLKNWEFEDRMWVGEAVGFSEWLRPDSDPQSLRSMALDFDELSTEATERVLETVGLPLTPGMTTEQLKAILGEPAEVLRFVPDRITIKFNSPEPYPYKVSCTVANDDGLRYLVIMVPLAD